MFGDVLEMFGNFRMLGKCLGMLEMWMLCCCFRNGRNVGFGFEMLELLDVLDMLKFLNSEMFGCFGNGSNVWMFLMFGGIFGHVWIF